MGHLPSLIWNPTLLTFPGSSSSRWSSSFNSFPPCQGVRSEVFGSLELWLGHWKLSRCFLNREKSGNLEHLSLARFYLPLSGSQASQDPSQLSVLQSGFISLLCPTPGRMVHLQTRVTAKPGAVHSVMMEPSQSMGPEMELQSEAGGLESPQSTVAYPVKRPEKGAWPSQATTATPHQWYPLRSSGVWLEGLSPSFLFSFLPHPKLINWCCPWLGWVYSTHWIKCFPGSIFTQDIYSTVFIETPQFWQLDNQN